jgi:hypothetical protein
MTKLKSYQQNKARHKMFISKTTLTKHYETLKAEAQQQCRTSLEFCIWFDYDLVPFCNLATNPFNAITQLIDNGHILNDKKLKPFRLACIIFQKFMDSDHSINMLNVHDFLSDFPQYADPQANKTYRDCDVKNIYEYDGSDANKRMFPYFERNIVSKKLIAIMIARGFLAYDEKYNNLVYVCQDDTTIYGVEKHGMLAGNFILPEYVNIHKPYPFMYWNQYNDRVTLKTDIKQVIFFDETLYMLQELSKGSEDNTLYCSLHTADADIKLYQNGLELIPQNAEIYFNFSDKIKEQKFMDKVNEYELKQSQVAIETEAKEKENIEEDENTNAWLGDDDDDEEMPF